MKTEEWCRRNNDPVCPYCGGAITDANELELPQEDCEVLECGTCELRFEITLYVDVVYTTRPVGGW